MGKDINLNYEYFEELKEQISNKNKWDKNKFFVFNYEAGTGKSIFTHEYLGEYTKHHNYKILYVQKFKKDNELEKTVNRINQSAGKNVAGFYTSEKVKEKKDLAKKQVLAITHRLYQEICKNNGNHTEFIKDRQILIIDEYPQIHEEVIITKRDISDLWRQFYNGEKSEGNILAGELMKILIEKHKSNSIVYKNFKLPKYDYLRGLLKALKEDEELISEEKKEILNKIELLLNQGFFVLQNEKFISYDKNIQFKKLRNNIILDANAGFDCRYVNKDFHLQKQKKKLDYSSTKINHYKIKTNKGNLKKEAEGIFKESMREIDWENAKNILFVTDKNSKDFLEKIVKEYHYDKLGVGRKSNYEIDYFGNLIGRNDYRDFDNVVILKTPNYSYKDYLLEYYYLTQDPMDGAVIELFQDEKIEKFRISLLAGEIYQAIKRINRDNTREARVYLFTEVQEAINIVINEMPNVQYQKYDFKLDKKRSYRKKDGQENQEDILKKLLLVHKKKSKFVSKKRLREELKIKSASNLTPLLNALSDFMEEHNMEITTRKIIFN